MAGGDSTKWSEAEVRMLREHWHLTAAEISPRLGRTEIAVESKRKMLRRADVTLPPLGRQSWLAAEVAVIASNLDASDDDLAALFPYRARGSVLDKRGRMRRQARGSRPCRRASAPIPQPAPATAAEVPPIGVPFVTTSGVLAIRRKDGIAMPFIASLASPDVALLPAAGLSGEAGSGGPVCPPGPGRRDLHLSIREHPPAPS